MGQQFRQDGGRETDLLHQKLLPSAVRKQIKIFENNNNIFFCSEFQQHFFFVSQRAEFDMLL
jgi:hypothetical protein